MKWYHQTWAIIVAFLLFFPIGFILLWTSPKVAGWAKLLIPIAFLGFIFSFVDDEKEAEAIPLASTEQLIEAIDPQEQARLDSISAEEKKQALKELAVLKKKFIFEGDDFSNGGWYYHKRWGKNWPHRNTLMAHVNSYGYSYLISNYWADDWLFHTKVQIKIGDYIHKTAEIPKFDKNNHTEVVSGGLYEVLYFTEDRDYGAMQLIARGTDKPIKVRLQGEQYYKDYTLSSADKKAIKECYELANLIQATSE